MSEFTVTEESLNTLLAWLDPDRATAADKYETIRRGLIRIFVSRGFSDPERMTDAVFDRVMRKLPSVVDDYVGDPASYFFGFVRFLCQEEGRRREVANIDDLPLPAPDPPSDEPDENYECLVKCLKFLSPEKRDLVLAFYNFNKDEKIGVRKALAGKMGITSANLRVRAHRIRNSLEKCVLQCAAASA